ncbi:MAG TPA: bifunctional nicotinamidase/pyrazinamidase [Pirellulales bacterium]|nr:bifunctional nicotinamidase/pyrazinamidase [Pirellulales bacterium]
MNALIVVDVQNDFLPGGALPVTDGQAIVALINALQPCFDMVVATQDWHPPDHVSFAESYPGTHVGEEIEIDGRRQILWPVHCIAGSPGAALAGGLETARIERMFRKGVDRQLDSYSGFYDDGRVSTGLGDYLRQRRATELYLCGLALEYCVRATALDAQDQGFKTHIIVDATRALEAAPGDMARAIESLQAAGVELLMSDEVRSRLAV